MASSYGKNSLVLQTFAARVVYKSWVRLSAFVGTPDSVLFALSAATQGFFSHFPLVFFHIIFKTKCPHSLVAFPYFLFAHSLSLT